MPRAARACAASLNDVLHDGGRAATAGGARQRGRNALVVFQMAAALVLMATAGLAVRSALALLQRTAGLRPGPAADASRSGSPSGTYAEPARRLDVRARRPAIAWPGCPASPT